MVRCAGQLTVLCYGLCGWGGPSLLVKFTNNKLLVNASSHTLVGIMLEEDIFDLW